ncbi:MAG TPA: DoxX family protein [Luteibacter sp.]|uniref:DoxX family protein n=1 Tax=Luteibacter sp. TaxID=1886636 RepID=UPI002F3F794B
MPKISWRQALPLVLAIFFVVGSLINIVAPGSIYEEYLKWGYPPWFHFFTGTMELTAAILLVRKPTRLTGALLGGSVMFAALATVVIRGEYAHAVPPLVAVTLSLVVGWTSARQEE